MLVFLQIFVLSLLFWFILFHIKRKRVYRLAQAFEGPKGLPLIGNALQFLVPLTEMANVILEGSKLYPNSAKLWFGPFLVICTWDPEDVRIILNSSNVLDKHPYVYKLMGMILGEGLASLPVADWKRHRKLISPNFSLVRVKSSFDVFGKHAKKLVESLGKHEGGGDFEISGYLEECTLNSILESMLGLKVESGLYDTLEMQKIINTILAGIMSRATNILHISDTIFNMSSTGKRISKARERLQNIIDSIIEQTKSHLAYEAGLGNLDKDSSSPRTFIEHLLSASDEFGKLTEKELREEIRTVIATSFDTTSTVMGYLLILLGMHPEIQDRVLDEIIRVLGSKKEIEYADLKDLKYLDRVIKETLRVFPIVVGFTRSASQEIQLENRIIPAGATVAIALLSLHRDPKIWPQPAKFDPDRFLPEEEAKRHPYSWIGFSGGARNCIGSQYGLMALKVMTVCAVMTYKIETSYKDVDDVKLTSHVLLKPTGGFNIRISCRN